MDKGARCGVINEDRNNGLDMRGSMECVGRGGDCGGGRGECGWGGGNVVRKRNVGGWIKGLGEVLYIIKTGTIG